MQVLEQFNSIRHRKKKKKKGEKKKNLLQHEVMPIAFNLLLTRRTSPRETAASYWSEAATVFTITASDIAQTSIEFPCYDGGSVGISIIQRREAGGEGGWGGLGGGSKGEEESGRTTKKVWVMSTQHRGYELFCGWLKRFSSVKNYVVKVLCHQALVLGVYFSFWYSPKLLSCGHGIT